MPIDQNTIEALVQGCIERTVAQRYAGQEMAFEKAADLTELKLVLVKNVVFTIKREMGVLPGQSPRPEEEAEPPAAAPS
jgi:hypothetical protein